MGRRETGLPIAKFLHLILFAHMSIAGVRDRQGEPLLLLLLLLLYDSKVVTGSGDSSVENSQERRRRRGCLANDDIRAADDISVLGSEDKSTGRTTSNSTWQGAQRR